jgi:hypothetical protein
MKMFQFTQQAEKRVVVEYCVSFTREELEEWLFDYYLGTIEEIRVMSDQQLSDLFTENYELTGAVSLGEIAEEEDIDSEEIDRYKIGCKMFDTDDDLEDENE